MELFNLEIPDVKASSYSAELMSYSTGYRILIGDPGTNKTTFSLWSMRNMMKQDLIGTFVYVDFDSKSGGQAKARHACNGKLFSSSQKHGFFQLFLFSQQWLQSLQLINLH